MEGSDSEARALIAAELDVDIFVDAGPGSGKTRELVARIVSVMASGRAVPADLAAITFTEAAASELRSRVRSGLQVAGLEAALESIDEAQITTLHGFARHILAMFPEEAGIPWDFEIVDEVASEIEERASWLSLRSRMLGDPHLRPVLERALTLGARLGDLREVARGLHASWDRLVQFQGGHGELSAPDLSGVLDSIALALEEAAAEPDGRQLSRRATAELAPFRRRLMRAVEAGDERAQLHLIVNEMPDVRAPGSSAASLAPLREALQRLVAERASLLDSLGDEVVALLLPPMVETTIERAADRAREGRLEYHDLLVLAVLALRRHDHVRETLAKRFRWIFVDELQDTDPLQLELVELLSSTPGQLFGVGDENQSIYRFRRADLHAYRSARQRLAGRSVQLLRNHRSVPAVVDWVNTAFGELLGDGFAALHRFRSPASPGGVVGLGGPREGRAAELRSLGAAQLAEVARDLVVDGDVLPSEIAVLLPTRAALGEVEAALEGVGLPSRIESRSLVHGTDEVHELTTILAACVDPADPVMVTFALRGPGFACTDSELAEWRLAGGELRPGSARPAGVAAGGAVERGLDVLGSLHEASRRLPTNLLVDEVLATCGLIELAAVRERPRDHWRRYRFVLDEARAFVEAGGAEPGDFVAWMRQQAEAGAARVEVVTPEPDDEAVRILTVHGAKGLEFRVVLLAGLDVAAPNQVPRLLWRGDVPLVSLGLAGARVRTAGYEEALDSERAEEEQERTRLLYVAATRARDLLVLGLWHRAGARCPAQALVELDGRIGLPWIRSDDPGTLKQLLTQRSA